MLQRIGLAQAVVHDPRLVVLDEPTASVDLASSRNICDLILDLFLRQRIMIRGLVALAVLLVVGALKFPVERNLAALHRQEHFDGVEFNLDLREKIGQLGFIAALSGFRAIVTDALFIQAYSAWENTEWGRMLLLFRHVTTLQPHMLLFWDMAAWHMAWNASVAAMNDQKQPRLALRVKAQREYFTLGKDFLERGIKNNPDREGRERDAYERVRHLYDEGPQERLSTLTKRLRFLEDKLGIPQEQRIPAKEAKSVK